MRYSAIVVAIFLLNDLTSRSKYDIADCETPNFFANCFCVKCSDFLFPRSKAAVMNGIVLPGLVF